MSQFIVPLGFKFINILGFTEQIEGKWEFFMTNTPENLDLFEFDTVCTHKAPNRIQIIKEGTQFSFPDGTYTRYEAFLEQPNKATLVSDQMTIEAKWSMLYDQGLIIETSKLRLYTNFKYTLRQGYSSEGAIDSIEVSSYHAFNSECDSTMVGVVHHKDKPGYVSCFYGNKLDPIRLQTPEEVAEDEKNKVVYFSKN